MRYILIILAIVCCSISGKAQTDSDKSEVSSNYVHSGKKPKIQWDNRKTKPAIEEDKISAGGLRHIITTERLSNVFNKENSIIVNLCAFVHDNDTVFYLHWNICSGYFEPKVKKDTPVLLKLGDGSRLELNITQCNSPFPTVMSVLGVVVTIHEVHFYTNIKPSEILELQKGLTKIRVEVNSTPYDVVLKKDNLSSFILDNYLLIKERLKDKKSFYDDF